MKIGIIGAGTIGNKHAEAARTTGDEIAWVIDPNAERGNEFAKQYDSKFAELPEALWSDDSVEAVVIGVPNWLHKDVTIQALRAGKNVLLEKPMALNIEQCHEIAEVAAVTQHVLQVGFVHRYTGVAKAAKEMAASGALGDIYSAQAFLFMRRNIPGLGKWFTNKEFSGGGTLIDVGVHLIDLAMHVLDFPQVDLVHGQTFQNFGVRIEDYKFEDMWAGPPDLNGICNVEDAAQALIRFSNGTVLDLHVAWAGNFPRKHMPESVVSFCGTKAGISFELFGTDVQHTYEADGKVLDKVIPVEDGDFFLDQYLDFKQRIETRDTSYDSAKQACDVQAIVDAIYASSDQSQPISREFPASVSD